MALHYTSDVTWYELLKKRRLELNMTGPEMARLLKISPALFHKYETGKSSPAIHHCVAIAKVLDMELIDFITTIKESRIGERICVALCADMDKTGNRDFKKVQCGMIVVKLRENEKNRRIFCINHNGRIMLFAERKRGVPTGEYIELKGISGQSASIKFSGPDAKSDSTVRDGRIFAQYRRDVKDYIMKSDTKNRNKFYIVNKDPS